MPATRTPSLDHLRSLAALAVVCLHVAAGVVVRHPDVHSLAWWAGNVADAASRWCVPVFVMISGALLLGHSPHAQSPLAFLRHRYGRLLLPIMFWSALYLYIDSGMHPHKAAADTHSSLLNGTPWYHLWYLYMLIGLYPVTPVLRALLRHCSATQGRLLALGAFLWGAVEVLVLKQGEAFFLFRFLPLLGYFLAGHLLFEHSQKNSPGSLSARPLVVLFIGSVTCVAWGAAWLFPRIGMRAFSLMYAWQNPLVIIMSLAVFLLITHQWKPFFLDTALQRLAPLSFGIYLLHPLWLLGLAQLGLTAWHWHPALGIPVLTAFTFALSAISVWTMQKCAFLRRTVI